MAGVTDPSHQALADDVEKRSLSRTKKWRTDRVRHLRSDKDQPFGLALRVDVLYGSSLLAGACPRQRLAITAQLIGRCGRDITIRTRPRGADRDLIARQL